MQLIEKKLKIGVKLPELIGGNGQQRKNKEKATAFIAKALFGITEYDGKTGVFISDKTCLLYTSDAADE